MLVGSYSSNYYGRPRSTRDADFVVILETAQLSSLQAALGPDFRLEPQMSFEAVTMTTRHIIEHPSTAFKIELFLLSDDAFDQSRFARRRQLNLEGHAVWLPTPEDVIVQKLRWSGGQGRGKDLADAAEVVRLTLPELDLPYIRHWTSLHGTADVFEKLVTKHSRP
jgi:hypothetical protein